ncbi:MAG: ammonia monooxygenase [Burkholderiales bacterium]|nr:ammonia monooxygenase [Burkholderiales bacterium]
MSQLSRVLRDSVDCGLIFWCPGCDQAHRIQHGTGAGPRWTWNGDAERPVFSPSILVTGVIGLTREQHAAFMRGEPLPKPVPMRCHSFVGCNGALPGQITFLADSTHALAGKTVDLPPWDEASTT